MTVFAASLASPPGIDPMPVAGHPLNLLFSLTREAYGHRRVRCSPGLSGRGGR
ncbi:hypothetical protein GCM10010504_06670 [Streptomyces griseus]|nr:hypothetical protein GCM10010504_06670 [Streptomyces griseus]